MRLCLLMLTTCMFVHVRTLIQYFCMFVFICVLKNCVCMHEIKCPKVIYRYIDF